MAASALSPDALREVEAGVNTARQTLKRGQGDPALLPHTSNYVAALEEDMSLGALAFLSPFPASPRKAEKRQVAPGTATHVSHFGKPP